MYWSFACDTSPVTHQKAPGADFPLQIVINAIIDAETVTDLLIVAD
jgi:hypothetical protein